MVKYQIIKTEIINAHFVESLVYEHANPYKVAAYLDKQAKRFGWKFTKDNTPFGGHFDSPTASYTIR